MRILLLLVLISPSIISHAQNFTQVSVGLGVGGAKDGGAVWADFDNDGDMDVLVNTSTNTPRSVLLQRQANGSYSDVTLSKAYGITLQGCDRSAVWGDMNNDGNLDFIRNYHDIIEIYISRGAPNFIFGADYPAGLADEMAPNFVIRGLDAVGCSPARASGLNAEGVGLLDYNNDGWLDIILENAQCGIDILENRLGVAPASGSSIINTRLNEGGDGDGIVENSAEAIGNNYFRQVTIPATSYLGFGSSAGNGDYLTVGDYNSDGLLDLVIRKPSTVTSIWRNNGNGTFSPNLNGGNASLGNAIDANKGGTVMCDFDRDGDFDIFWSDAGINQIWLQTSPGIFVPTAKPVVPAGADIDGCACGDVDLDGDTDLLLGNSTINAVTLLHEPSYLFINETTASNDLAALNFTRRDIAVNADAEGINLVDYDKDGDYDIYVNVNGAANQLWESDFCDDGDCNFLNLVVEDCIDGTLITRPVIGAAILLRNEFGTIVSAKVDGSTANGHGAQNPPSPLIAIPTQNDTYIAEITFPVKGTAPAETHSFAFVPAELATLNTLVLRAVNGNNGTFCSFSPLPIELLDFTAVANEEGVILKWTTASEFNNDYFSIERSRNGKVFESIGSVTGNGTKQTPTNYSYMDIYPYNGTNYYRLVQHDYDGKTTPSKIIRIKVDRITSDGIALYPNPVRDHIIIDFNETWSNSTKVISVYDMEGNKILTKEIESKEQSINLDWDQSLTGFYWIKISSSQQTVIKKLVKI